MEKTKNSYFNKMKSLVMMQFKDKVDFSFLKSTKKTIFKIIYTIAIFVLLTAVSYVVFNLIVKFNILSLVNVLNFKAFAMLFGLIVVLSFISCLINITKTLYFSKDNSVLLTLPTTSNQVFTSKIIVVLIYELVKNLSYMLPFLIAYGMVMKLQFIFFLWVIIAVCLTTVLLVVVAGLLSIPAMILTTTLKKYKWLELIVLSTVVALSVIAIVVGIRAIPTDINLVRDWGKIYWNIQSFLDAFARMLPGVVYFTQLSTGTSSEQSYFNLGTIEVLFTFLFVVGLILICFGLTYLLSRPLFFKMASSPFEFRKKDKIKTKVNRVKAPFVSVVGSELKKNIRTSNFLYTILAVSIIAPIAVMFENQIIAAMDTRILGGYMCLVFNMLIAQLLIMSANSSLASIYSRDGNSAYLNKVNPVRYSTILFGKLVFNIVVTSLSLVVCVAVMDLYLKLGFVNCLLISIALISVNIAHILWSAELDVMNPQNSQYQTTGDHNKNPNETKSIIIAFITTFIFAFITFFLITENYKAMFGKIAVLSIAFMIIRIYLYFTRVKLYYKEK